MRLRLDQGDYSGLLTMTQTENRDGLSQNQIDILNLMGDIARGKESEQVEPDFSWKYMYAIDDAMERLSSLQQHDRAPFDGEQVRAMPFPYRPHY